MIAFDTNVLVYAEDSKDPGGRHARAATLLTRLAISGAIVPVQVLGEFINVCCRKTLVPLDRAIGKVANYSLVFDTPQTEAPDIQQAALLADRWKLQFFDALIITVAARAGATELLSEDMQDGLVIEGLTVLNPFDPANAPAIDALIG